MTLAVQVVVSLLAFLLVGAAGWWLLLPEGRYHTSSFPADEFRETCPRLLGERACVGASPFGVAHRRPQGDPS